jgi:hypothetical protein
VGMSAAGACAGLKQKHQHECICMQPPQETWQHTGCLMTGMSVKATLLHLVAVSCVAGPAAAKLTPLLPLLLLSPVLRRQLEGHLRGHHWLRSGWILHCPVRTCGWWHLHQGRFCLVWLGTMGALCVCVCGGGG